MRRDGPGPAATAAPTRSPVGAPASAHDNLELEMVQTVTGIDEQLAGLGREQRAIAALCREVVSVAEISARLDLLLGGPA